MSMMIMITSYPNKPRELKKFILGLVKSWIVKCIQRINYVKSYYILDSWYTQSEEKILILKFDISKQAKVESYFAQHHPYKIPEMIYLSPTQVNDAYLKWIESKI